MYSLVSSGTLGKGGPSESEESEEGGASSLHKVGEIEDQNQMILGSSGKGRKILLPAAADSRRIVGAAFAGALDAGHCYRES